MYQPTRTLIDSGFANLKYTGPDSPSTDTIAETYLARQERKYKETNDYFDIQREEMNSLAGVLNGTYGADNSYLNQLVVSARDEYKEVLKGTKLKDYRSPEIQDKLFEIKNRLANAKNLSATSLDQIARTYTKAKATPSNRMGETEKYLTSQLALPPDQRDPDIDTKVFSDPLFLNSYDNLTSVLDKRKTETKNIQQKDENFFYSYEATFRPDLGYFNEKDEWVFDPKEGVIDEVLANPQQYNAIEGMLPASLVQDLKAKGHTTLLNKHVRDMAKKHLHEIFVREEGGQKSGVYDPKLVQKGRTLNPAKYARPTAADKTEAKFDQEVAAIQQRLSDSNPLAFDEYLSPDGWRSFDFEFDEEGNVTGIVGTMVDKENLMYGKTMGAPPTKTDYIPVNVDDLGSVKQALSRIKFVFSKDKKSVSADPLKKQENKSGLKSNYTIKGKSYSIADLKKLGYTEEQIKDAVKLGTIK